MIRESDITIAGVFTKTHGVKGELNAILDIDLEYFESHDCILCLEDGIPTPFFIESFRPKGSSASLIKIEDIDSEQEAKRFIGNKIYVDKKAYRQFLDENEDDEGEYASDMIGWSIKDAESGDLIGEISDINLDTANPLFIVTPPDNDNVFMIPIADEFICDIDEGNRVLTMSLPDGLLNLNA